MNDVPAPVFVGGTGRSGTTVVARLIGHHRDYALIPHEARFHCEATGLPALMAGRVDIDTFSERMARWFERSHTDRGPGLIRMVDRATFESAMDDFRGRFAVDARTAAARLVRDLLDPIAARQGKPGWVEMSPRNVLAAPMLLDLFDGMRLIEINRDGRDAASSIAANSDDFDLTTALEWWSRQVGLAKRRLIAIPESNVLRITLEDLVRDERAATYAAIVSFLGAGDDAAMRTFFDRDVTVDRARIGRWQDDPAADDRFLTRYEAITGELRVLDEQLRRRRPRDRPRVARTADASRAATCREAGSQ